MQAEVVAVGSELLLGQIIDTNSAVIARHFATIGLDLFYKTTVGDNLGRLAATLRQALGRSEIVVTTGGIGPTADDVTREAVAAATDRELVFSEPLMRQIEAYFAARGFRLSPSNRRQAYIPVGAIPRDPEVRLHDPEAALYGGADGLDVVRAVSATARRLLRPGGTLVLEHGESQGADIRELLTADGWSAAATTRDLLGRDRATHALR